MFDFVFIQGPSRLGQPKMYPAHLGVLYLMAVLERQGAQVAFADLRDAPEVTPALLDAIPPARWYAFTATTGDINACKRLAQMLKARDRGSQTIIGGPHASHLPEDCIEHFDVVARYEWEHTIGLLRPGDQGIIEGTMITDLDSLPWPARHLVGEAAFSNTLLPGERGGEGERGAMIVSSRGCSFHCHFCVPQGQKVMTARGMIDASQHGHGLMLTHMGRWKKTTHDFQRAYSDNLVVLQLSGYPAVKLTPEHPVLTARGWQPARSITPSDQVLCPIPREQPVAMLDLAEHLDASLGHKTGPNRRLDLIKVSRAEGLMHLSNSAIARETGLSRDTVAQIRAGALAKAASYSWTLQTDPSWVWYSFSKRRVRRFVPATEELLYALGVYLAEGSVTFAHNRPNSGTVVFTFGRSEEQLRDKVRGAFELHFGLQGLLSDTGTAIQLSFSSGLLARLFSRWFGKGATQKRIPPWILSAQKNLLWQLMQGYLAGDGHYQGIWYATTVSESLAYQLTIASFALGARTTFTKYERGEHQIAGRTVRGNPFYILTFSRAIERIPLLERSQHVELRVESVALEPYTGNVFNWSVEDDESYTLGLMAVHNCANIFPGHIRFRSPENVAAEVQGLIERYGCRAFRDEADNLVTNKAWLLRYCELLAPLGVRFKAHGRSDLLDEDRVRALKEAGCVHFGIGLESADPRVLTLANKKETVDDHRRAVALLKAHGILAHVYIIMGLPGETPQTLELNMQFMREAKPDRWTCGHFIPYPGCEVWNHPMKFRAIIDRHRFDDYLLFYSSSPIRYFDVHPDILNRRYLEMYEFLLSDEWRRP